MKAKIIYFDDDKANLECLTEALEDFNIIGCSQPERYVDLIKEHQPHAYMIDVRMPILNGFELYEKITLDPHYNGCPVFFISGDVSDENKIKSFQNGAVDFFSRDLRAEEMTLRLSNKIKLFFQSLKILEIGNLKLDMENFKAYINDQFVDLTMLEFRILSTLFRASPRAVHRDEMTKTIWGKEPIKQATIHTHLANLRSKISGWTHVIKVRDNNIIIANP